MGWDGLGGSIHGHGEFQARVIHPELGNWSGAHAKHGVGWHGWAIHGYGELKSTCHSPRKWENDSVAVIK